MFATFYNIFCRNHLPRVTRLLMVFLLQIIFTPNDSNNAYCFVSRVVRTIIDMDYDKSVPVQWSNILIIRLFLDDKKRKRLKKKKRNLGPRVEPDL